jgi:hypothetical protein
VKKSTTLVLIALIAVTGSVRGLAGNQTGPTKSVQQAASDGDIDQLKLHLAKGANLNTADSLGNTPLKLAIQWHHTEAARLIIDSGKADLNAKDSEGKTPLIVALTVGEKEIAEALIAKGVDIKAKDKNDVTALNAALRMGQVEVATTLIEKGVDVNAGDKTGQTPLTLAQQRGMTDIVALLKQKGAKEPVDPRAAMYGDYAMAGNQGQAPGPAAAPAPAREAVVVDVNAVREEIKPFQGLDAALKAVDDKSVGEQAGWIQRRADNRTLLVMAVDRQFAEEMAFVKPIATEEKAAKTLKAMDSLATARKKRFDETSTQLREQRRAALATGRDNSMNAGMSGRSNVRGRGRSANTGAAAPGYAAAGPYGAAGARAPRRPAAAEVNQPVLDQETQAQVQAWLNANPEDKKSLLEAVHQMNLVDLDDLRKVAVEEQAKKTAAALSGVMMLHEERVQKITKRWQEDDERMQRMQERYGPGGMQPGRGTQPGMQQQQPQQGMRRRGGR